MLITKAMVKDADIATLYRLTEEIETEAKKLKTAQSLIDAELIERSKEKVAALLKEKDEPYGVVNVENGAYTLKITTQKKVEWDQDALEETYDDILESGSDPKEYMKVEYKIEEKKYAAWPEAIKKFFIGARTVSPGNAKVEIVLNEKEEKEVA